MEKYRITFGDDSQMVITAGSLNQAIASAVRHDKWSREIVKVEKWSVAADKPTGNSRTFSQH
jgi:glucose/arabinose dehydrogenase